MRLEPIDGAGEARLGGFAVKRQLIRREYGSAVADAGAVDAQRRDASSRQRARMIDGHTRPADVIAHPGVEEDDRRLDGVAVLRLAQNTRERAAGAEAHASFDPTVSVELLAMHRASATRQRWCEGRRPFDNAGEIGFGHARGRGIADHVLVAAELRLGDARAEPGELLAKLCKVRALLRQQQHVACRLAFEGLRGSALRDRREFPAAPRSHSTSMPGRASRSFTKWLFGGDMMRARPFSSRTYWRPL